MLVIFRQITIDLIKFCQCEIALAVFRNSHLTFNHVASVQIEASDLAWTDVNIICACCVAGIWAS